MGFLGGLTFGPGIFLALLEALGIFLGLDFCSHTEYPPPPTSPLEQFLKTDCVLNHIIRFYDGRSRDNDIPDLTINFLCPSKSYMLH